MRSSGRSRPASPSKPSCRAAMAASTPPWAACTRARWRAASPASAGSPRPAVRASRSADAAAAASTVAPPELGLDQHAEQVRGSHPVVGDEAQAPAGGGPGQVEVALGQVQPGGREQGLHEVVPAEQQRLGLGQPALADPEVGEGDRGCQPMPGMTRSISS